MCYIYRFELCSLAVAKLYELAMSGGCSGTLAKRTCLLLRQKRSPETMHSWRTNETSSETPITNGMFGDGDNDTMGARVGVMGDVDGIGDGDVCSRGV